MIIEPWINGRLKYSEGYADRGKGDHPEVPTGKWFIAIKDYPRLTGGITAVYDTKEEALAALQIYRMLSGRDPDTGELV